MEKQSILDFQVKAFTRKSNNEENNLNYIHLPLIITQKLVDESSNEAIRDSENLTLAFRLILGEIAMIDFKPEIRALTLPRLSEILRKLENKGSNELLNSLQATALNDNLRGFPRCKRTKSKGSPTSSIDKLNNRLHYPNIAEVIMKVCEWRSLCYEKQIIKGKRVLSKALAAERVHIKKKSLDDYLMFLRLGISMNFDFKNHFDLPFNDLRKYIKGQNRRIHWKPEIYEDVESLIKFVDNSSQDLILKN